MLPAWQTATVIKIEQVTHDTRRFWLRVHGVERFEFKPGQFVTLDLPISEQRNKRWRSYSIASPPDESNVIELIIVELEQGVGSRYIFQEVIEGSEVKFRGPQGVFLLPDISNRDLFMICTGTGIAPFRSMLRHILNSGMPHRQIHLVFGTNTAEETLYLAEMQQLEKELEGFKFHYIFSCDGSYGETGYVHKLYVPLCLDNPEAQFMICGWRTMIDDARTTLRDLGFDSKAIHVEIYG